jgi:hypothetical protein
VNIVSAAGCTSPPIPFPPSNSLDAVMTQQTSVPSLLGDRERCVSVCTVGEREWGGGEFMRHRMDTTPGQEGLDHGDTGRTSGQ